MLSDVRHEDHRIYGVLQLGFLGMPSLHDQFARLMSCKLRQVRLYGHCHMDDTSCVQQATESAHRSCL